MASHKIKNHVRDTVEEGFDTLHRVADIVTFPLAPIDGAIHGVARGIFNWLMDEHPGERTKSQPAISPPPPPSYPNYYNAYNLAPNPGYYPYPPPLGPPYVGDGNPPPLGPPYVGDGYPPAPPLPYYNPYWPAPYG